MLQFFWPGCPKYVIEGIVKAFKRMIYSIFEIPEKTSYSAVLLELGFLRMKHVIAKLQTTYMNQIIIWEMQGTKVNEVIMEELKMHREKSMLGLVLKLANEYGFDDMTDVQLNKVQIKQVIRMIWRCGGTPWPAL